jgi:hypothetical protein
VQGKAGRTGAGQAGQGQAAKVVRDEVAAGAAALRPAFRGRRSHPHQQQRESARPRQGGARCDHGKFPEAGRYPFNSTPNETKLAETIAALHKVKPENIVVGAGSQEILKSAVRAFTSPFRPWSPRHRRSRTARALSQTRHPVYEVKVDSQMRWTRRHDRGRRGAGLVFLNNPNNPTATVHSLKAVTDFVERVRRISPDTVILIDEAYHDYVTDPEYQTAIPLALSTPNVFVARTFSKAYGMAACASATRLGTDTVKPLARLKMPYNVSVFGIAAAIAPLNDPKHIEAERRATPKCAPSRRSASSRWAASRRRRRATSSSSTSAVRPAIPRRVRGAGRDGRTRLPAVRKHARARVDRHHGRDAEGYAVFRDVAATASPARQRTAKEDRMLTDANSYPLLESVPALPRLDRFPRP